MATQWYRVNATAGLNVRDGAGTSYDKVGSFAYNDQIEVSEVVGGWAHVVAMLANGEVKPVSTTVQWWCSAAYLVKIAPPEPEPEPDPDDTIPLDVEVEATATVGGVAYHATTLVRVQMTRV